MFALACNVSVYTYSLGPSLTDKRCNQLYNLTKEVRKQNGENAGCLMLSNVFSYYFPPYSVT